MIAPGSVIGVLGGGQLGRMLALAAASLGYRVHVFAPETELPAADVSFAVSRGSYADTAALAAFADAVDVITYEFENVPSTAVALLETLCAVHPCHEALDVAQDRCLEKQFVHQLGGKTAPYAAIDSLADLKAELARLGPAAILKTRRMGYDGKGQVRLGHPSEAAAAFRALGGADLILEGLVRFDAEFSIIVARGADGCERHYPAIENHHVGGILSESRVPAGVSADAVAAATSLVVRIADELGYVGVLTCEFFATSAGPIFNEMAPRVHNSGHWTIEGASTSQFEQHIRAICGLPLGSVELVAPTIGMRNLLGDDAQDWAAILAQSGAHLHLYGKATAEPGRKMGHVTTLTR